MKNSKLHLTFVFILFAVVGSLLTGFAGTGLLYLIRTFWYEELFESISYLAAFVIAAVPGLIGSLYWTYFFIKKERRETKHLKSENRSYQ